MIPNGHCMQWYEKEDELSQLGGDAIKDPDTNEKTLAERQALLKDVDFWKPHHGNWSKNKVCIHHIDPHPHR